MVNLVSALKRGVMNFVTRIHVTPILSVNHHVNSPFTNFCTLKVPQEESINFRWSTVSIARLELGLPYRLPTLLLPTTVLFSTPQHTLLCLVPPLLRVRAYTREPSSRIRNRVQPSRYRRISILGFANEPQPGQSTAPRLHSAKL